MTDEAMSPLRRRMIEDMTIRKLGPKTQQGYIRTIRNFAAFVGRSPDTASLEDVRCFQLHLAETGAHPPILNHTVSALRFFFRVTLGRHDIVAHTTFIHEPRKLPVVLSPEEVARLLNAASGLKYKAALSVAYGAGLRAAEVISLKVSDIDSKRMIIRVEQGKGRKDRYVMLSPSLLELLRVWWRAARPPGWLFPGRNPVQPMTTRQLNRACHAAAQAAGIEKNVSLHTLRKICQDANMPARSTIFGWLEEHEEFARRYTLARQIQIEDLLDEILEIADDSSNDWIEREGPDGKKYRKFNPDSLRRSKLRIAAREWLLSKLMPKRYSWDWFLDDKA
jgi:integrase